MTKRNSHIIVIKDVEYKRKDCEITVLPPDKNNECRFPYESRSERRDQYRNAIFTHRSCWTNTQKMVPSTA